VKSLGYGQISPSSTGLLDGTALEKLRREAAIFAAPTVHEPFGREVLEAAGDRCALVLDDVPSLRGSWEDAAIFVDPGDHRVLKEVLACLLDAPGLREDLAERAWRRAADHSIERTAIAYRRLCRKLRMEMPA
jgi:glycosyltransferase involved in cell wall biosynthesis